MAKVASNPSRRSPGWIPLGLVCLGLPLISAGQEPWRADLEAMLTYPHTTNLQVEMNGAERFKATYDQAPRDERSTMENALREHLTGRERLDILSCLRMIASHLPLDLSLALAWESLAESGDELGAETFLYFCTIATTIQRPEIVPYILRIGQTIDFSKGTWGTDYTGVAKNHVVRILRNCGEAGTQGLIDLGWYPGQVLVEDLYGDQEPRRHTLLMENYEKIAAEYGTVSIDMLGLLLPGYTSNPEVRDFMREKITLNLWLREGDGVATNLGGLLGLIEATRDDYFVPYLQALSKEVNDGAAMAQWTAQFEGNENELEHVARLKERLAAALKSIEDLPKEAARAKELARKEEEVRLQKQLTLNSRGPMPETLYVGDGTGVDPFAEWTFDDLLAKRYRSDIFGALYGRIVSAGDVEERNRLQSLLDAASPVEFPGAIGTEALLECLDPRTQTNDVREGAISELANRVAAGGGRELASAYDGLAELIAASEADTARSVLANSRFILPPDACIDLLYSAATAIGGTEGAILFAELVHRGSYLVGPSLGERRSWVMALEKEAGDKLDHFRMEVACGLLSGGPAGVRTLAAYPWGDGFVGQECVSQDPEEKRTRMLMENYGATALDDPVKRADILTKLVALSPYREAARDFVRAELPLNLVLSDHPDGPRALMNAAYTALATDDPGFTADLRRCVEALQSMNPETMTSPSPRIDGGWAAALDNLAQKIGVIADRLAERL